MKLSTCKDKYNIAYSIRSIEAISLKERKEIRRLGLLYPLRLRFSFRRQQTDIGLRPIPKRIYFLLAYIDSSLIFSHPVK